MYYTTNKFSSYLITEILVLKCLYWDRYFRYRQVKKHSYLALKSSEAVQDFSGWYWVLLSYCCMSLLGGSGSFWSSVNSFMVDGSSWLSGIV